MPDDSKLKKVTTNATLLKLKGTPFKNASDLKTHEEKILKEEWQNIERARVRRELLMKEENRQILSPFLNGFNARFSDDDQSQNLVRVYLTEKDTLQIDIDQQLKSKDTNATLESLVKSLVNGFMGGYLTTLGLKDESLFKSANPSNSN